VARALGGATAGSSRHPPAPHDIEILAGPGGGPRARVLAPGDWPDVAVSLSHSAGMGFSVATAGEGAGVRIGCDIEAIAPRSDRFVSDYLTAGEAAWVRVAGEAAAPADQRPRDALGDRHVRANLLWSAKESVLKALGEGLRKDTRSVVVEVDGPSGLEPSGSPAAAGAVSADSAASAWHPLTASTTAREGILGLWRLADGLVWTVVGWEDEGLT